MGQQPPHIQSPQPPLSSPPAHQPTGKKSMKTKTKLTIAGLVVIVVAAVIGAGASIWNTWVTTHSTVQVQLALTSESKQQLAGTQESSSTQARSPCPPSTSVAGSAENLVPNPDFGEGITGRPGWNWGHSNSQSTIDLQSYPPDGQACGVQLAVVGTASIYHDFDPIVIQGRQCYTAMIWVRAPHDSITGTLDIWPNIHSPAIEERFTATSDWQLVTKPFCIDSSVTKLRFQVFSSTGTLDLDGAALVKS